MDIERVHQWLDEIADTLPEPFFHRLNGGICLLPHAKYNPVGHSGDLLIMGEYVHNHALGRYINIYFGSFAQLYPHATSEYIQQRLREVLLHEFTHHLESLAGEKDLELEDARWLRQYLESRR